MNILGETTNTTQAGTCEIELNGILYSLKATLDHNETSNDSSENESEEEDDIVYEEELPTELVQKVME